MFQVCLEEDTSIFCHTKDVAYYIVRDNLRIKQCRVLTAMKYVMKNAFVQMFLP